MGHTNGEQNDHMKIFSPLYNKMMEWAKHRHAPYYLATLSFAESSFFPIPPDFMLMPMSLARRDRAFFYASITTLTSVLGGLLGYCLGVFFFSSIHQLLIYAGYEPAYHQVVSWFAIWGFWIMFFAGFAFIPYKLFTIAAGATHMALLPFILGSFVGRGGRFFIVTSCIYWGGEKMENLFNQYMEKIGWGAIILITLVYVIYHFK